MEDGGGARSLSNAQVVTVSSHIPSQNYYRYDCFLESLRRFAEVPTVLGTTSPWRGLMTKPFLYREWLRGGHNTSDRLIICDAWDVLFLAHPHGIGDRCAELFGDSIVFNGERGLWPCGELTNDFPDTGTWRYLNSGFMCGPADKILALLESMDLESIGVDRRNETNTDWIYPNDQGEIQKVFAKQVVPMVVDTQCQIAMTFSATADEDFHIHDNVLYNRVTGTTPGVGHFNGGGMNQHFDKFRTHWGFSDRPVTA